MYTWSSRSLQKPIRAWGQINVEKAEPPPTLFCLAGCGMTPQSLQWFVGRWHHEVNWSASKTNCHCPAPQCTLRGDHKDCLLEMVEFLRLHHRPVVYHRVCISVVLLPPSQDLTRKGQPPNKGHSSHPSSYSSSSFLTSRIRQPLNKGQMAASKVLLVGSSIVKLFQHRLP